MRNLFLGELVRLRNFVSGILNKRRPKTEWRPEFEGLDDAAYWIGKHFVYEHDPLGGIVDNTKSVGCMFQEYLRTGEIHGDCDDVATLWCWSLLRFREKGLEHIGNIWRVNIPRYMHVICVFTSESVLANPSISLYHYASGGRLFMRSEDGLRWFCIRQVVDAYGKRYGKKPKAPFYAEPVEKIEF